MDKKLYLTGEFAKKANVSVRTIHYYEKIGLIHPETITENGYRYYSTEEFARLQRILTLKLLGFSLEEIQELSLNESNKDFLQKSFEMQLSLVRKKIEHLQAVEESIRNVSQMFEHADHPDWDEITKLIHIISMDNELVEQYKNGKNLSARAALHNLYSHNPKSWFSWIYENLGLKSGMEVLEIGCGNGMLWKENLERIPENTHILLTDLSPGMIEDTKQNTGTKNIGTSCFSYQVMDAHHIEKEPETFDVVTANFVLFYLRDLKQALSEVRRVLKEDGIFVCAAYGENHMREVEELVREFEPKIRLSQVRLYENFGIQNGKASLQKFFHDVTWIDYPDYLKVTDADALMDYIMSCHGNQREYLVPTYEEFKLFLKKKLAKKGYIKVTKQAGLFIAGGKRK
ncbi:MAG: MerR family transcriptional regulator [Roseburia sp.]|nr:MerR family transcriptional regulator [Roseburia sp.]